MIVSCGDSFFYGIDLSDCPPWSDDSPPNPPSQKTWPALIAKKLGQDYQCFASVGVGNLQILKQVIQAQSLYGKDAVYLVNWTWIDRFDYVDCLDDSWRTIRPALDQSPYDHLYYKHFHSELADKFKNLVYISQACEIMQGHRCVMTYMDHLLLDSRWHAPDYVKTLQAKINDHLKTFDGLTFLEWSRRNHYPESQHWHPLDLAHKQAADAWLSTVSEL